MGPKRPSDSTLPPDSKVPRVSKTEHSGPQSPLAPLAQQREPASDFSGSVRKRLVESKRTGQACDRCKVRKIRCDARPEGCLQCAQNRTPCKTTDRITGRATTRGHTEATEGENAFLRAQIAALQAQLKEVGVEPRAIANYNDYSTQGPPWSAGLGGDDSTWDDSPQRRTSTNTSPLSGYAPAQTLERTEHRSLPTFKQDNMGDNYLGVSSADSLLTHIKGTSLAVFGSEIDITDFVENEDDYDQSVFSYQHFLKVAWNDEEVQPMSLPPYQMLTEYATWYLRSMNPYTMLIDKPTMMQLIWRIGNEPNFVPSTAETVCVHMMLATLTYQISVRNGTDSMLEESHKHYRYSLSFFKDLLRSHTWEDVQAMTLICHHLRNFPKPGAAWLMCSTTFLLAIELGLHRSSKAWANSGKMDKLEIEMRKRVFWTLHALATNLSGKLGRPMPISVADIDVEFPEPINDCLPGEGTNLSPFRQCSYQVGIQISKYTVWSAELFRTIYAVRSSPDTYEVDLKKLEAGIRQWKEEIPPELQDPARASPDDYIIALYLEYWHQEFQLLLHHPAVCRSTKPEVINSNLDKCLESAQRMLYNCVEMTKRRSLDIPWINTVVYIAAIFTTLFIYDQRKDQMSATDVTKLKNDMDQWSDVMTHCGELLGSGDRLKIAINRIVEQSLSGINGSIVKRTATESLARAALQAPQEAQNAPPVYGNGNFHHEQYSNPTSTTADPTLAASSASYNSIAAVTTYSYSNDTPTSGHPRANSTFGQQPYGTSDDQSMPPSHAAALAAASSGATSQPSGDYGYPNSQAANSSLQPQYSSSGVSDWHSWSRTYMQQGAPSGEYMNTASTLMALGGREGSTQGQGQNATGGPVDASVMQTPGLSHYAWPSIQYALDANGHVAQQ
ncbi:hypothetical protein BDV95DRAFT_626283 [Massariosphaeria phaeospora]|uniref:Zn(2)-C6 fungal-type domain-containing protein n=1 Tax=Massariosphaeria phaeospora TaxID=100035 RepID=A0A7C8IFZ4_9PLEO|nr:hypothetical protein BDV95DRAFT_626283 [Massariosphaeria phaeospora]